MSALPSQYVEEFCDVHHIWDYTSCCRDDTSCCRDDMPNIQVGLV